MYQIWCHLSVSVVISDMLNQFNKFNIDVNPPVQYVTLNVGKQNDNIG